MTDIFSILREITDASGSNAKKAILEGYRDNKTLQHVLKFVFDPLITSGISDKKLVKASTMAGMMKKEIPYSLDGILDYLEEHNHGSDADLLEVECYLEALSPEDAAVAKKIISQDFHDLGLAAKSINKVIPNLIYEFSVQLAEKYYDCPEAVKGHSFTATIKYDGFRTVAIKRNGKVSIWGRSGKESKGLVDIVAALEAFPEDNFVLDCEGLITDCSNIPSKEQYKRTSKLLSAKEEEKHGISLNAFDYLTIEEWDSHNCTHCYEERRRKLDTFTGRSPYVIVAPVLYSGNDESKIVELHQNAKEHNMEGVMINLNDAMYEFRRTKKLLKCKAFNDCDAWIDGVEEGNPGSRNEGRLGAFKCHFEEKDGTVVSFECGGGFSDADRDDFWNRRDELIGRVGEFKYFEITQNKDGEKSVRFPVFKTLKEEGSVPHNFD